MGNEKHTRQITTSSLLQAALTYSEKFGFSIIPIRPDKKPYLKWEEFQTRRATREEIIEWWGRWPMAMIGIITGAISGIVVIDIDTREGHETIQKYIPETLIMPTCRTPREGKHLYFKHPGKPTPNNAKVVPGCDFRGDGGYVIAPPSVNKGGKAYAWLEGLGIHEVGPPSLPDAYINYLNSFLSIGGGKVGILDSHAKSREVTRGHKILMQGRRDNDLFHVANCLVKGRTPVNEIDQYLGILAKSCDPPFSASEVQEKIKSALKRAERQGENIADELRRWIEVTDGHFEVTQFYAEARVSTPEGKHAVIECLRRMVNEGIIEKYGTKRGVYRKLDTEVEVLDWKNVQGEPLKLRWPFEIERHVKILPRNIIVVAGEKDTGKTAFLLDFSRLNMHQHDIYYFSSEMGELELQERISKFGLPWDDWKFKVYERSSNFSDVIRPDSINVIDFFEINEDSYKLGLYIRQIFDKLKEGIAVIALQKNKGSEYGIGRERGAEKARLYLTIEPNRIKILHAKNWATRENPNNLQLNFKLAQGCKFTIEKDWHK